MDWMDYDQWPGPDEPEDIPSFVRRMGLAGIDVNGSYSADGVTTHFTLQPDGSLVNNRPFTISAADLNQMDHNLQFKLEHAVGQRWYNPYNSTWNITPLP